MSQLYAYTAVSSVRVMGRTDGPPCQLLVRLQGGNHVYDSPPSTTPTAVGLDTVVRLRWPRDE